MDTKTRRSDVKSIGNALNNILGLLEIARNPQTSPSEREEALTKAAQNTKFALETTQSLYDYQLPRTKLGPQDFTTNKYWGTTTE